MDQKQKSTMASVDVRVISNKSKAIVKPTNFDNLGYKKVMLNQQQKVQRNQKMLMMKQKQVKSKLQQAFERCRQRRRKRHVDDQAQETEQKREKIKNLMDCIQQLTKETRIKKAVRHLNDALNMKTVRNDIESNNFCFINIVYFWQTNNIWQGIMFILTLSYIILTYFEPSNSRDTEFQLDSSITSYEYSVISILFVDLIFEITHLLFDYERMMVDKFFKNFKFLLKFLFDMLLLADCFYFYTMFPQSALRFARYVRPFMPFFYSMELRRAVKSILLTIQNILQLIFFFILITFFFALIGFKFIADIEGAVEFDQYSSNFNNLLTATNILYGLISFDGYPECMLPSIEYSKYYLIYFISYLILQILVFVPIPVAVIFEAFRGQRSKLAIMDRLKQREALLASFICLDFDNQKHVSQQVFQKFMNEVYLQKKRYKKRVFLLYRQLDKSDVGYISLNQFFELVDQLEKNPWFHIPAFPDLDVWIKLRHYLLKYLKLKIIAKSLAYEIFMFIILIINCCIILASSFVDDENTIEFFDQVDDILLYFYISECVIKLIGLGFEKYFEDDWNIFDFAMVILSLFSNLLYSLLQVLRSAKSAKASKILRLTKINRVFKMFRAIRTVKVINFFMIGADMLSEVQKLISRIILCIPLLIKFVPIILIIFYVYGLIGCEIFNTATNPYNNEGNPYQQYDYADFQSFGGSQLLLLQVMLEANWTILIYDYAYKFGDFVAAMAFFDTFDLFISLVLLSLLKGIVWEVFTVVENTVKDQSDEDQKNDDLQFGNYIQNITDFQRQQQEEQITENTIRQKQGVQQYKQVLDQFKQTPAVKNLFQRSKSLKLTTTTRNNSFLQKIQQQWNEKHIDNVAENECEKESINNNIEKQSANNEQHNQGKDSSSCQHSLQKKSSFYQTIERKGSHESNIKLNGLKGERNEEESDEQPQNCSMSDRSINSEKIDINLYQTPAIQTFRTRDEKKINSQIALLSNRQEEGVTGRNQFFNYESQNTLKSEMVALSEQDMDRYRSQSSNKDDNTNRRPSKCNTESNVPVSKYKKQKQLQEANRYSLSSKIMQLEEKTKTAISQEQQIKIQFENLKKKRFSYQLDLHKLPHPLEQMQQPPMAQPLPDVFSAINQNSVISSPFSINNDAGHLLKNRVSSSSSQQQSHLKAKQTTQIIQLMKEQVKSLKELIKLQQVRKQLQQGQMLSQVAEKDALLRQSSNINTVNPNQFNHDLDIFDSDDEEGIKQYIKQIFQDIADTNKEEQIINNESQNQKSGGDLKQKKLNDGQINQNFVMKQAYLKDSNMDKIKKFELDYFQEYYGNYFKDFHQVDVTPILRYESFLLLNFQRLLRYSTVDLVSMFQIIQNIEKNMSDVVFSKGSIFKIVFQDSMDNWFCIDNKIQTLKPLLLSNGPWNYKSSVFLDNKEIYMWKDILNPSSDELLQNIQKEFYQSFRICAQSTDIHTEFLDINPNYNIFDFFTIFFNNENEEKTIELTTQQILQQNCEVNESEEEDFKLPIYCKSLMIFIVLDKGECEGQQKEVDKLLESVAADNNQNLLSPVHNTPNLGASTINQDQNFPPKVNQPTRSSYSAYNFPRMNANKFEKRHTMLLSNLEHLKKQTTTNDRDKIGDKTSLPQSYIFELLKNLRDVLEIYQTNLFVRVSELLTKNILKNEEEEVQQEDDENSKQKQNEGEQIRQVETPVTLDNKINNNKKNKQIDSLDIINDQKRYSYDQPDCNNQNRHKIIIKKATFKD